MFEIFSLVLPFFGVIACGLLGARLISDAGQQGLNQFVQYFALPALLFSLMARGDLANRFEGAFVTAYTSTSITLAGFSYLLFHLLFKRNRSETAIMSLGSVYGNIGYMGIPIVVLIVGPGASVPAVVALIIDVIVIIPLMSAVIVSANRNTREHMLLTFGKTFSRTVRSPFILAALLGALLSLSGLTLPGSINSLLDILAAAAAPCALFALGASLYGKPIGETLMPAVAVSLVKLIVHPALLYLSLTMVFSIDSEWAEPAVIAACLPVALTVYIIARQYDSLVVGASTIILLSTALSLVTVPLTLLLLS